MWGGEREHKNLDLFLDLVQVLDLVLTTPPVITHSTVITGCVATFAAIFGTQNWSLKTV